MSSIMPDPDPSTEARTTIELFRYRDRDVRTVLVDSEPWFVANDVCAVLEIVNVGSALARLDDDEKGSIRLTDGTPGNPNRALVSEPGLYTLTLRSDKPEAKTFRRWVTHEVLPRIRRTGRYEPTPVAPALPDLSTAEGQLAVVDMLREQVQQRIAADQRAELAEHRAAELEPAAASWETLATAHGDFLVGDAAKILSRDPAIKLGRDRLFTILRDRRWIYRQVGDGRWRCYQTAIDTGWLTEVPASHYHPRTGELVLDAPQVRVTVRGLGRLHQLLGGTAPLAIADDQLVLDGGAR